MPICATSTGRARLLDFASAAAIVAEQTHRIDQRAAALCLLDGVLQAELAGRDKDRRDAELEAQPDDAPEDIGVLVRPLEARVIVELGKAGQDRHHPQGRRA